MNYSYAIVLKNYKHSSQKLLLFDQHQGLIEVYASVQSKGLLLTTGSIMRAMIVCRSNRYTLEEYQLDFVQPLLTDEQLLFLHELVLFCKYCLPHRVELDQEFLFLVDVMKKCSGFDIVDQWFVQYKLLWFIDSLPSEMVYHRLVHDKDFFKQVVIDQSVMIDSYIKIVWSSSISKANIYS